ncbi:MAG: hypothetical protein AAGF11_35385 [Myxococcota bacterium]
MRQFLAGLLVSAAFIVGCLAGRIDTDSAAVASVAPKKEWTPTEEWQTPYVPSQQYTACFAMSVPWAHGLKTRDDRPREIQSIPQGWDVVGGWGTEGALGVVVCRGGTVKLEVDQ